jgi:hypothetical protein
MQPLLHQPPHHQPSIRDMFDIENASGHLLLKEWKDPEKEEPEEEQAPDVQNEFRMRTNHLTNSERWLDSEVTRLLDAILGLEADEVCTRVIYELPSFMRLHYRIK